MRFGNPTRSASGGLKNRLWKDSIKQKNVQMLTIGQMRTIPNDDDADERSSLDAATRDGQNPEHVLSQQRKRAWHQANRTLSYAGPIC
jgi:hypothetical protein